MGRDCLLQVLAARDAARWVVNVREKRLFSRHFFVLPRPARDKHRKRPNKQSRFLAFPATVLLLLTESRLLYDLSATAN
eukprot:COSAG06_NODE_11671_length_1478_cov_8.435823_1_plen_79_part_00